MGRGKLDKTVVTEALARHVLTHGLSTASLRPMARAAGTSDRMLIYHFGSKDGVIGAVLDHLAQQMASGLEAALPPGRADRAEALLAQVLGLLRADQLRPYVRIWMEILAEAAAGSDAHRRAADRILTFYLDWIAARHPDGSSGAAPMLALIEGVLVLDAAGHGALADAAVTAFYGDITAP